MFTKRKSKGQIWRASQNGANYLAELKGIKLHYSKSTGNRETSGVGSLLPRHFFKPRWQRYFKEIFSQKDFDEICRAVKSEYELFQKNPEKYKRAPF
jgi:hypothetical protein